MAGADDDRVVHLPAAIAAEIHRINTSSSAMVGWSATVASKSAFLSLALNRNRRRLEDLRRIRPDHVDADDAVGRSVHDQLVERPLVAASKHILHRAEVGRVGLDLAQLVARLALGHARRRPAVDG